METTEIIRILRQCGDCCLTNCEDCPEYKKAGRDPEAQGFMWSCGGVLLEAADRLESLDKRWKRTRLERDQARQMRERAERLLGQAREEALDLRKDIEAQGEIILELNRDLKRCREALNGQGEHEYLGGDLISREALIERIENVDWYHREECGTSTVMWQGASSEEEAWFKAPDIFATVREVPAVEAEPVVHAHWIPCGQIIYGGWNRYNHYCSHCGIRGHTDFKRCPECGAHMDEEVAE